MRGLEDRCLYGSESGTKKSRGYRICAATCEGLCPQSFPYLDSFAGAGFRGTLARVGNVSVLTIFWILPIVSPDVVSRSPGDDPGIATANDPN
jgi:hypothetical protein